MTTPGASSQVFWRTVCSLFYAFGIKEGMEGRLPEGGRKQGGNWITGWLTRLGALLSVVMLLRSLKKRHFKGAQT